MKKTRWEGGWKKTKVGTGEKNKIRDRKQQDGDGKRPRGREATPMREVNVIFAACIFI